jgi:hypothetical protein
MMTKPVENIEGAISCADNYITKFAQGDAHLISWSARARASEKAIMLCKAAVMGGPFGMNIELRWWCNLYEKSKSLGPRHVLYILYMLYIFSAKPARKQCLV